MAETLADRVRLMTDKFADSPVANEFLDRLMQGNFTRDENPQSHFCVYFAAYDPERREVFIGHHKKSGLWLFNGGHIDKGETPEEALVREIGEEWGVEVDFQNIGEPKLITVTSINNPIIKCTRHFDIWYFVPVSKTNFTPDKEKLDTEFYTTGWKTVSEAKILITCTNTLTAISTIESLFDQGGEGTKVSSSHYE